MERIVLAPAITGIPELIADGETGFLISQNCLADFLDKLIGISGARPSLSKCSRREPGGIFNGASIVNEIWIFGLKISSVFSKAPHNGQESSHAESCIDNKYNFRFSGTEAYLFETMELMRSRGHEAALFSMADRSRQGDTL